MPTPSPGPGALTDARQALLDRLAELEQDDACDLLPDAAFFTSLGDLHRLLYVEPPLDPAGGRDLTICRPACQSCGGPVDYDPAAHHALCQECGRLYPDWLEPEHSLLVYAERIAHGFAARHPADRFVEDTLRRGVIVHHLEGGNGVAVMGLPVRLGGAA